MSQDGGFDRVPPQNLEAEQAVLGSMLLERAAVERAGEILKSEDFYREAHRIIFDAIVSLIDRNEPADLITVSEELRSIGQFEYVGGQTYLLILLEAPSTSANVEYYAALVEEKAILRKLVDAGTQIHGLAYSEYTTIGEVIDRAEQVIFSVGQRRMGQSFFHIRTLLDAEMDSIEHRYDTKQPAEGYKTGLSELDWMTGGMHPSDLIIIAARPSMGKTSLAVQIAQHIAINQNLPAALFSLEMSKEQLVTRMICSEAQVNAHKLRTGNIRPEEWRRVGEAVGRLSEAPIYIDDTPDISAMEMRGKCRRLKAEHGLGVIMIDYMQLMRSHKKSDNRNQELSDIARACKTLARELKVPVLALSQLSRAVETRPGKKQPMLSDLRESGAIEAEADLVIFIYRDSYYATKEIQTTEQTGRSRDADSERPDPTELIIAKHRNGPTGTANVGFMKQHTCFVNMDLRTDAPQESDSYGDPPPEEE